MKLLCDEDVGTGVPNALAAVGLSARSLVKMGLHRKSDVDWLTFAGRNGWLVFSYNKKMLLVETERETILREKVGIVFVTTAITPVQALILILRTWDSLEFLDATESRPFARFLTPNGRLRRRYKHYPPI